jgi:spore coat protein U-like protein
MRSLVRSLLGLCVALVATAPAFGQCSWRALPASINFGTYSVFGGASNTTTTSGTVRCTGAYTFTVASTTGGSGSYTPREMNGPGTTADYNVFTDAGRTNIWGNGTGGTSTYSWFNFGGTNDYSGSAYGTVPGAQDLAPGAYTDTFQAVLSYRPWGGGATTTLPGVNIVVSMTVQAECRVNTFNLTFGNYDPLAGAALNQNGVVNIYCTRNTPATFALDNGANALGAQKRMASGANRLNYTATLASGSGTATSSLTPIGNGIALNGSIPPSQDVPVGNYVDTLQVVVNY